VSDFAGMSLNNQLKSFSIWLFPFSLSILLDDTSIFIKLTIISISMSFILNIDDVGVW